MPTAPRRHAGRRIAALYASYGLTAAGLVPHFVFLADFVARGLGRGVAAGAWAWVLFGLGAAAGPVLAGTAADRIGFAVALRLLWALAAAGIGVLAFTSAPAAVAASALVVGTCGPASTALALGRIHELLPGRPAAQAGAWGRATIAFALLQAIAAYALSFVFARTGDYAVLFAVGGAALLLALAIDLAGDWRGSGCRPRAAAIGPAQATARRRTSPRPSRPKPSSATVAGSGTFAVNT